MAPTPFLAPSLVRLRAEINARWPGRSTVSDGWIGNAAHQKTISDHNPDATGCVRAIDVTSTGIAPLQLLALVEADPHGRARYVIWDRHIYQRKFGWVKRPYTGASPHTEHVHISILQTAGAADNSSEWFGDDDMPIDNADADKILNRKFARNLNGPKPDELSVDMQTFAERTDAKLDDLNHKLDLLLSAAQKP